ncbi:hypothetical protein SLEP1_g3730 [Rubroshorea leprosula]|uniref:Uncharacterized protein n=1 Tax=Rubroshorea leprosula TaxID=152421 RepID=A0AAV5HVS3_9ROSI|nr:hypothetical protein SLEP1_g3730 [Rubroshorea leprosula]
MLRSDYHGSPFSLLPLVFARLTMTFSHEESTGN